jgi:two-component system sensor kinase FixL
VVPKKQASPVLPREKIALLCGNDESMILRELLAGEAVDLVSITFRDLRSTIEQGTVAALLIGIEILSRSRMDQLRRAIAAEPTWSDIPILLLAERHALDKADALLDFGQIRVVERPLHRAVLIRAVRSACRSRSRQRQGLALSHEVLAAEEHYRRLAESLEVSRARQIADLEALSERLTAEINERRRTEQALRESQELYRYSVELGRKVVWKMVPGEMATTSGSLLNELTGLPLDTYLGDVLQQNAHPEDRANNLVRWEEVQQTREPFYGEFRLRVADGSYHVFMSRAVPHLDEQGNILRWYGFIEDINDHKIAMEALRQAEERYRLAARATNDAIWDWNVQTGHVAWSDAAAAYLGNEPLDNSTIEWWENAIHPDDRQRVLRSIYRAIESDKSRWSAAYRLRKADGDFAYVYDRGFIIRDNEGAAVRAVGAVVDLTERRRAESELRRTQAELIHISRVSAMGTMASTLAHELNQPLTAVTSYVRGSRRLLASFNEPAIQQVCEALEFAEAGALRAGQIVRRLRELVARGAVEVRPEDLKRLVEDASVLAFVDEHLHGITHAINIDADARWVEADRIQIQQVLINLIRNAIQALQGSETRHVTISAHCAGEDMVEVSVVDTGSGIPASVRDALFSPFHSTKSEGMGIGLSISRTIVEAHHGRIWAEDRPEGGTIFRFTLPRADVVEDLPEQSETELEHRRAV